MTVGPVTTGGKSLFNADGVMNERLISRRAQSAAVPMIAPYPSGHGNCVPSAAVGQYPLAYICDKVFVAMGMMANDVPTTEIKPVPI